VPFVPFVAKICLTTSELSSFFNLPRISIAYLSPPLSFANVMSSSDRASVMFFRASEACAPAGYKL
jgi:hypothetical protein